MTSPPNGFTTVTAGPWPKPSLSNLPIALSTFIGRDTEIGQIAALLHKHRLVTVTGAGGVGKTRVSIEVANTFHDTAECAVRLVELAPLGDSSLVAAEIARALGVQEVPNRPLLETLVACLKNDKLLIVLDNCEHVVAEAARVAETLLSGCDRLKVLATSRESLRLPGEYGYRLPSLEVPPGQNPEALTADEAARYGAVALFAERARAVDGRFALTNENAETIAELCRRLDGIPLAIELAAARIRVLPPHALAARIQERFALLTSGPRTVLPRQQTMRATIDWSYDLLSEQEQQLFIRLSVFAGGCTLETAAAVCVEDEATEVCMLDTLSSLVDKSLVAADLEASEPRYHLLESFRQYGREKLEASGKSELIFQRHAVAFANLAERLERSSAALNDERSLGLLAKEMENGRTALDWALIRRRDIELGHRLVISLFTFWGRFKPAEGRRCVREALALVHDATPRRTVAILKLIDANISGTLFEHSASLDAAAEALGLFRSIGDRLGEASSNCEISRRYVYQERVHEAQSFLHQALETARALQCSQLVARCLNVMLGCRSQVGDFAGARVSYQEALSIYRGLGARHELADLSHHMAETEFRAGNPKEAIALATSAFYEFGLLDFQMPMSATANNLATYKTAIGRYGEASDHAREALRRALNLRVDNQLAWALQNLAALAVLGSPKSPEASAERAARTLGFVDGLLAFNKTVREYTEQHGYDRLKDRLVALLGADRFNDLTAHGAMLSRDEAIAAALNP